MDAIRGVYKRKTLNYIVTVKRKCRMNDDIKMNMLRKRAKGISRVVKSDIDKFSPDNVSIMDEFLQAKSATLSPQSLTQYRSALRIWFRWLHEYNPDKNFAMYEVTNRIWLLYIAWLNTKGLAPNSVRFKKASVSSMCVYIRKNVIQEEIEYEKFQNSTEATEKIPRSNVYEKVALKVKDLDMIVDTLLENENLLVASFAMVAFYSCGRRAEIVQIKVDDIYKDDIKGFIVTDTIRGKGEGDGGNPIQLKIPSEVLKIMRQYVETRGFESDYVFANSGSKEALQPEWCTTVCRDTISPIASRRINPHLFRASGSTYMLEQGIDIKMVSKFLNHAEIGVTSQFYDLRTFNDELEDMYAKIMK